MGRMGHVTDLNGAAVWLLSPASNFVTGTDVLVGKLTYSLCIPANSFQTVVTVLCKILELNEFLLIFELVCSASSLDSDISFTPNLQDQQN